jgi:iron(II)-dependent oxidoreductase
MPHEVTLAPFFLDRHEVTNQQFAEVLDGIVNTLVVVNDRDDHTPRYVTRSPSFGAGVPLLDLQGAFSGIEYTGTGYRARPGLAQLPVVQVSWYGATLYCETMGRRLPTDHEWEAAARGRENRKLPWGDGPPRWEQVALPDDGRLVPVSSSSSQPEGAVPVGTSRQDVTPEGVFDLAGNVTEWTSSSAGPAQRGPQDSPETAVNLRFVRGGSWAASVMARPSGRIRRSALTMATNYGFRCAKQAVDE